MFAYIYVGRSGLGGSQKTLAKVVGDSKRVDGRYQSPLDSACIIRNPVEFVIVLTVLSIYNCILKLFVVFV